MALHGRQMKRQPAECPVVRRIVTGARQRFLAQGFRGVTMDDLAEELGMSKRTFYAHFPSKAALLEAVLLDKFHGIDRDLARIASARSTDVVVALPQLLACLQRHTEEIQPAFVWDIRRETPELFSLVERRRRDVIQRHFGRLLSAGRRAGLIRADIPSKLIIEILLGAVQAVMNPQKMQELDLLPKSGYAAVMRVIFEGVITEAGRAKL
jgi:AcrR family transcriptional regulator